MKINITRTSNLSLNNLIIEVNSIDEAIKMLQTDMNLLKRTLEEDSPIEIPNEFVIKINIKGKSFEAEIEIYDTYRE